MMRFLTMFAVLKETICVSKPEVFATFDDAFLMDYATMISVNKFPTVRFAAYSRHMVNAMLGLGDSPLEAGRYEASVVDTVPVELVPGLVAALDVTLVCSCCTSASCPRTS